MTESKTIHATCVSLKGRGLLLIGESGSGKSDLALRLIDRGAALVADDQVHIGRKDKKLLASPPQKLRGLLEVRGIGIVTLPYEHHVPLALAVKLVRRTEMERLPPRQFFELLGVRLPELSLSAFDHSAVAKIQLVMKQ